MSVTLLRTVRLRVNAASAKPGPAIGQALGPLGINMAEFCKQFNEKTKTLEAGVPIPVLLSAYSNRTFVFDIRTPPTTWFLLKAAGLKKGTDRPGHTMVGKIHVKQIYEIALAKHKDENLKRISLEALCRCIAGSCDSMGIVVYGGKE